MSNGGIIDKLMGDSVLMFFDKPAKAMQAALGMFQSVETRNKEVANTEAVPMLLGIGMNTGDVCLGTIGTAGRMETTTLGDAVNVASRVSSLAKMYQTPFLCTDSTHAHLRMQQLHLRALGPARVKGRPNPVDVFEVCYCLAQFSTALTEYAGGEQCQPVRDL